MKKFLIFLLQINLYLPLFYIPTTSLAECIVDGIYFDVGGRAGSGVTPIDRANPISEWDIRDWDGLRGDDVSTCDVSNINNFFELFWSQNTFNDDISSWDVSNGTDMGAMFFGATSFNQNISEWDVSNVSLMDDMFRDATSFDQYIRTWNVDNVIAFNDMFFGATQMHLTYAGTAGFGDSPTSIFFGQLYPPTANAGSDQTVSSNSTVTLDGTSSSDYYDFPLTYTWSQTSGTSVTLSSSSAAQPSFTAPTLEYGDDDQILVFSLFVNNGTDDSDTDTVTITVRAPDNTAPTANAGADQSVSSAASVTLDGTSSSDANNDSLTYSWTQTSGTSVTLSNSSASQPTFTAPTLSIGDSNLSLVFSLVVNDGTEDSTADTVTITVTSNANSSPVANAGPDQTVSAGAIVTLDGTSSSDADGHSLSYAWTQTSGTSVTLSSSSASQPTFTAPTAASTTTLIFSLVVTDTESADSSADTVTITVNPLDPTVAFNNVKSEIDTLVNEAVFTAMQNYHQVTNTLSSAAVNRAMNNSCGTFKDQYYANVNSNSNSSTAKGKLTWSSIKDTSRYVKHQSIEFIHRDLEDGPNTSHLSFTLQWEDCTRDTFLWGYFAGAQAENSDLENSTFTNGEYNSTGLKVGSYFVKSLHQNAYWDGIISAPYNFNQMSLDTSLMHTSSDYETKMISAGTGLTGQIAYKFITFKPNVNLRYSSHHSERVKFIASVGSQQSDNYIDLDRLEQITLRLRPSFVFELNQSNPSYTPTTLIVDPELSCDQKVVGTNTQRCTQGISVSFSQIFSNDVEFSLETGVQSNNDRNTHHFRTNIQIPF